MNLADFIKSKSASFKRPAPATPPPATVATVATDDRGMAPDKDSSPISEPVGGLLQFATVATDDRGLMLKNNESEKLACRSSYSSELTVATVATPATDFCYSKVALECAFQATVATVATVAGGERARDVATVTVAVQPFTLKRKPAVASPCSRCAHWRQDNCQYQYGPLNPPFACNEYLTDTPPSVDPPPQGHLHTIGSGHNSML